MSSKTFKGGIHPPYNKERSRYLSIENLEGSKEMIFPLSQHIGAPASPVVKVGDRVCTGQLIAAASGFVSANIHSSVSGTITAIKPCLHPNGAEVMSIVIENDFKYEKGFVRYRQQFIRHAFRRRDSGNCAQCRYCGHGRCNISDACKAVAAG